MRYSVEVRLSGSYRIVLQLVAPVLSHNVHTAVHVAVLGFRVVLVDRIH